MIYVYHTIRWVTNDKNDFAPHSRNNEVSMRLFQRQIRPECQFANQAQDSGRRFRRILSQVNTHTDNCSL
jgi:hypothetical protein